MTGKSAQDARQQLDRILRDSVQCGTGLREALLAERSALESQDLLQLGEIAVEKQDFLQKLERLESLRSQVCEAYGFAADPAAMPDFADWCDGDSLLIGYWNDFAALVRECKALNATNGAIVGQRHRQVNSTLAVLRGDFGSNDVYERSGRDNRARTKQILAQA